MAVTNLVDELIEPNEGEDGRQHRRRVGQTIKRMPRSLRANLAALACIYDAPRSGHTIGRWRHLRSMLKIGWVPPISWTRLTGLTLVIIAATLLVGQLFVADRTPWKIASGVLAAAGLLLLGLWLLRQIAIWQRCRGIAREVVAVDRTPAQLRLMLLTLSQGDVSRQRWPVHGGDSRNCRYDLTANLIGLLQATGYCGLMVVVDRVDEPTSVSGQADRMRSLIWPMLDNKFLQQDRIGLKLLLPLELRHMLFRESASFFQEARLDKQNLIDRLTWSGATLYDLCSIRLRACRTEDENPISLADLFDDDVNPDMIIDALDQMQQPRDAFKFLYRVIQEHCALVPEDQAKYEIARLTLETVRRNQVQRVHELHQGLAPA